MENAIVCQKGKIVNNFPLFIYGGSGWGTASAPENGVILEFSKVESNIEGTFLTERFLNNLGYYRIDSVIKKENVLKNLFLKMKKTDLISVAESIGIDKSFKKETKKEIVNLIFESK